MNSLELLEQHRPRKYYERLYSGNAEPWNYQWRGGEMLRHRTITEILRSVRPAYARALDIGCSLGQLTRQLAVVAQQLVALDVSETAACRARKNVPDRHVHFLAARLPGIPLQQGMFDLVVSADCIHEFLPENLREDALREISQILKPGGVLFVGDYMNPKRLEQFYPLIEKAGLKLVRVYPLHDRLWYQFESWFKGVRRWPGVRQMLASVRLAEWLRVPARWLGSAGSNHVMILAERKA